MLLASSAALAATTVYTWVDGQGVTHYSDQPHAGAKKMEVEGAPTFSALASSTVNSTPTPAPARAPAAPGSQCAIEQPSNQQMLMNAWSVSGHIRLPRQMRRGDRVILMLDGKVLPGAADTSGAFEIPQIDRGAHMLAAQVETPSGRVICEAPAITFYVHQPSRQAPQPANRPRF
ncbi:MAG: DUF4124 domain-containing protein [Steroidobacteraceae bacterium]